MRGIVSVYEICKEQDIDFKIIFTNPFNLSDFLIPNKINWEIKENELNYNTNITDLCYIDTLAGSEYEAKKQKQWFRREFKKKYKEYHVRTNASKIYNKPFEKIEF